MRSSELAATRDKSQQFLPHYHLIVVFYIMIYVLKMRSLHSLRMLEGAAITDGTADGCLGIIFIMICHHFSSHLQPTDIVLQGMLQRFLNLINSGFPTLYSSRWRPNKCCFPKYLGLSSPISSWWWWVIQVIQMKFECLKIKNLSCSLKSYSSVSRHNCDNSSLVLKLRCRCIHNAILALCIPQVSKTPTKLSSNLPLTALFVGYSNHSSLNHWGNPLNCVANKFILGSAYINIGPEFWWWFLVQIIFNFNVSISFLAVTVPAF